MTISLKYVISPKLNSNFVNVIFVKDKPIDKKSLNENFLQGFHLMILNNYNNIYQTKNNNRANPTYISTLISATTASTST